jgi:Ca2+-binding RTX toxin-like protein
VGDGHCPPGATDVDYCDFDPTPGDGGDTLTGGPQNNALFGGGGPNVLDGRPGGPNYIQAGPATNRIYGGNRGDAIEANAGTSTVYAGTGTNVIDARSPGKVDTVICSGHNDYVHAYKQDVIENCAHVFYSADSRDSATVRRVKSSKRTARTTASRRTARR